MGRMLKHSEDAFVEAYIASQCNGPRAARPGPLPRHAGVPTRLAGVPPQIDAAELRARRGELRREWRGFIEGYPRELLGRLVFRHPYAGRMSLDHALGTLEAHLDHHVPQVKRALERSR